MDFILVPCKEVSMIVKSYYSTLIAIMPVSAMTHLTVQITDQICLDSSYSSSAMKEYFLVAQPQIELNQLIMS